MVITALLSVALLSEASVSRSCHDALQRSAMPNNSFKLEVPKTSKDRRVTPSDLVRLRGFGQLGAGDGDEASFTVSPDERSVALQVRFGDPASNSYCLGLVVVDIATGVARLIDSGGELVRPTYAHAGILAGNGLGVPQVITPSWSPDGQWIAVLRRDQERTRAWRVRVDGKGAEPLTDESQDVTQVAWSLDGQRIIYRTDRALEPSERAIDTQGLMGWHYDDRFAPMFRPRPYPRPGLSDREVFTLNIATRETAQGSAADRAMLEAIGSSSGLPNAMRGKAANVTAATPNNLTGSGSEHIIRGWRKGRVRTCDEAVCAKARGYWPAADGKSVLFIARSGWGDGNLTFYRWSAISGKVTPLSTTADLLLGCRPLGSRMICAREGSLESRRLVLVDPVTGASRTLFNPNPEFDKINLGSVERLQLYSERGIKTFADLVLPPNFDPRRRYPMIVVQYESRGFLNGGTGEEFPLLAFAAADMVVLSFQRPADVATLSDPPPADIYEFTRKDYEGWADRRNVHSALMDGINQVTLRGFIDRNRIGITGLSDGIGTAAFALLNSNAFSVAALSGCCEEPVMALALQGPSFTKWMLAAGIPGLSKSDTGHWTNYSMIREATRVEAPLLIQAPDREYILSLPTYQALKETGLPVEMYIYPGEYHIKWQPTHKLAVYERALRWFAFWFNLPQWHGELPVPSEELVRWQEMRAAWRGKSPIGSDAAAYLPDPPAPDSQKR